MSDAAPLGKIADWFYRVEYQQRGSPHIHMQIWLENAPTFGIDSDKEVVAFINKVIKCQKPTDNPDLLKLVNRQIHIDILIHVEKNQRQNVDLIILSHL